MLVSVIVPVYKAEKWLHRCVDSILAQTMEDFELLLIDDGSPDRSGEICDEYAAKDSRVRVFHKENGGVSSARNLGLDNAQGEWISFVDADDILPEKALSDFLEFASCDVDIICGRSVIFVEDVLEKIILPKINSFKRSSKDYSMRIFTGLEGGDFWGRLYRRSVLLSNVFDLPRDLVMGEDVIGNSRIALNNSKDVVFIPNVVYCYRQHAESCMHTFETSPEYEQMFYDNLWKSVPKDKQMEYINYLIYYKIKTFDRLFGYSADVPRWIGSVFHKNLLHEIDEYKYKSLLIERLLLVVTNRTIRRILIFLKRIKNKISF